MARVSRVELNKRILIASDIHGNGHLLRSLLEKVNFNHNDTLILLGDYIEKGKDSLSTLRYLIKLSESGNVFCLQGNCDTLWEDLKNKLYRANIVEYMLWRKNSLLCDMCKELGIPVNADTDPNMVTDALLQNYSPIFSWLNNLPHIIESENYIFVHAGVDRTTQLDMLDENRCLVRPAFYEEGLKFDKFVVTGHMVLNNYCEYTGNKLSFMPILDFKRKIFMVDGGSGVKDSGQQNLLIIDDKGYHVEYADELPTLIAIGAQKSSSDPLSIVWNHNRVKMLKKGEKSSLCEHIYSGRSTLIPNKLLFDYKGELASYDFTDYMMEINIGDIVSVADEDDTRYLVKKGGVLGWANKQIFTAR